MAVIVNGVETEEWRQSPSLPSYEVSSLGRIRCIPYERITPTGKVVTHGGKEWYGCRAYAPSGRPSRVIFRARGKTYKVHQLVCEAFHGPAPEGALYVLHIDENPFNNRADNLKWGTQKENLNAPGFLEYCKSRTGDDNPARKGKGLVG